MTQGADYLANRYVQRSSWVEYLVLFGETDMSFEREKGKGKRPKIPKGKMPYGKGPKKD